MPEITVNWIKKWSRDHWPDAWDDSDMIVDNMMKDWWCEFIDDKEWDDEWERHQAFERWMHDVD